ncbi:MAG: P-II family nitrogen regulator [Clostridia bacterium]|nr:P-II family nitrogen regulator [Clostridia bacterium]
MNGYEMILCIVNAGFSELVMDAAREVGARGGTVIHARGTANKEAEQFFHIAIQPDKDIVLILVPSEIKDNVLHAIYQNAGLNSEGKGIAFSLPVDDVVGIARPSSAPDEPAKEEAKQETKEDVKEDNENK